MSICWRLWGTRTNTMHWTSVWYLARHSYWSIGTTAFKRKPASDNLLLQPIFQSRYKVYYNSKGDKSVETTLRSMVIHLHLSSITGRKQDWTLYIITFLASSQWGGKKQNRTPLKLLKVTHVENEKWQEQLNKFPLAYWIIPHRGTGMSPAFVLTVWKKNQG